MDGISAARIAEVKAPEVQNREKIQHTVIKDMEPDSFVPSSKKKINIAEVAIAGGTAVGVYKPAKTGLTKATDWIAKEGGNFLKDLGTKLPEKVSKILPKAKTITVYGGAAAAAIGAFSIAIRDKDGDGQLDLIEGLKKIANPG